MPNFNQVILMGHLTRDVEIRSLQSGTSVAQFGIAHNHRWKSADGQQKDDVSFFDCEAWGKTGETIAQYHSKGDAIMVVGRLKQETWDDKETKAKRSKVKVVVESFTFVKTRGDGGQQQQAARPATSTRPTPRAAQHTPADDADIPF